MIKSEREITGLEPADAGGDEPRTSGNDEESVRRNYSETRTILDEYFREFPVAHGLGLGLSGATKQKLHHSANDWLGIIQHFADQLSDPNARYLMSLATQFLVTELIQVSEHVHAVVGQPHEQVPSEPLGHHEEDDVSDEYVHVEDPVWDQPSMALFRDGDPEPLAALLLQGQIPSPEVSHMLGRMLSPSSGYRGYQLKPCHDRRKPLWTAAALDLP